MNFHMLKCAPEYFSAIIAGVKTCECRLNDRDFKLGDVLVLREYDPSTAYSWNSDYTGRVAIVEVKHCFYTRDLPLPRDKAFIPIDWAVMSIQPWDENLAVKGAVMRFPEQPFGPGCV